MNVVIFQSVATPRGLFFFSISCGVLGRDLAKQQESVGWNCGSLKAPLCAGPKAMRGSSGSNGGRCSRTGEARAGIAKTASVTGAVPVGGLPP